MEAMLLSSTPDQSVSSPFKHNRNPRTINTTQAFISRPTENFAPRSYITSKVHGGGLIGPPPSLYSSLPSSVLVLNQQQPNPPPPLLPLPISKPYSSFPTRNVKGGRISTISSPTNKKTTNSKARGLEVVTPKKSKSSHSPKKEEKRCEAKLERTLITSVSTDPSGPDPCDLPKKVSTVLKSKVLFRPVVNNEGAAAANAAGDDGDTNTTAVVEELACSIFSLAPPPSSLPLPKFSLKPKLGYWNVEAGVVVGVDAGATDSLRRLLRLR